MNIVFRHHPLYQLFVKLVLKNFLVMRTMHFSREIYLVLPDSYFLIFRILLVLILKNLCNLVLFISLFPVFCFGISPFNSQNLQCCSLYESILWVHFYSQQFQCIACTGMAVLLEHISYVVSFFDLQNQYSPKLYLKHPWVHFLICNHV